MTKRNTKRGVVAAGVALFAALALTGCDENNPGYRDDGWVVQTVATPRGSVTCVLFDGYDGDAISCDWEGAR